MRTRQGIGPSQKWDLIVIGGGIVGCSTAFYAARLGLRVLIVERDTPGSGQSGRNLGFVRQQGRDFRELPLAIAALRLWNDLEEDLGRKVGWLRGGNVVLAANDRETARQADWQSKAKDFGLDTILLTSAQTAKNFHSSQIKLASAAQCSPLQTGAPNQAGRRELFLRPQ